jgi:hypothetical protein
MTYINPSLGDLSGDGFEETAVANDPGAGSLPSWVPILIGFAVAVALVCAILVCRNRSSKKDLTEKAADHVTVEEQKKAEVITGYLRGSVSTDSFGLASPTKPLSSNRRSLNLLGPMAVVAETSFGEGSNDRCSDIDYTDVAPGPPGVAQPEPAAVLLKKMLGSWQSPDDEEDDLTGFVDI